MKRLSLVHIIANACHRWETTGQKKHFKLMAFLLLVALCGELAIAPKGYGQTNNQATTSDPAAEPSTAPLRTETEPNSTQATTQLRFRGTPIPANQVQSMTAELSALINNFELTLASAGVFDDAYPASSVALIEQLTQSETEKGEDEARIKIPARYVGSVKALNQAKSYRNNFLEFITKQEYSEASRIWVKAKNLLRDNFPTGAHEGAPAIKAIWLDRGTIVKAQSEEDLKPLFDRMKRAGINLVFFETINAGYPIYPSDIAPEQNPLTKGWDPLKAAVKLSRERDMEIHAWAWVFSAANQKHNEILELPKEYPGPILEKNPSWAITDRKGDRPEWISGKSFMDPANPEVREYLQQLFDEIVTRYDVDGLQLDYIRYPFQNPSQGNIHGYSFEARRQFQKKYQIDPIQVTPGHRYWKQWLEFKTENVDSFVQETAEKLKAKRPNLIISAAVFPMRYQIRFNNLQQNWQRWVKEGWVDLLLPMTYASSTDKLKDMTEPLFSEDSQGASLMIPGLRLLNMPSYKTSKQVQYIQQSPTPGYALFAAAHFQSALTSTLNRPSFRSPQPVLPHRMPIQAAIAEYSGLKNELHYWLSDAQNSENSDLEVSDLKEWAEQSDQFIDALTALQENPKEKNWEETQTALSQLNQSAQQWMGQAVNLPDSQQRRWSNRFQRLQTLLTYGEKHTKQKVVNVSKAQDAGE